MLRSFFILCLLLPSLAFASGTYTYNADGTGTFEVTLPSGQAYVEVFSRQNGIQNLAIAITNTEVANGDGTSTYSYTNAGYSENDYIEFRFYHYQPWSTGVFVPGPAEKVWYDNAEDTFETTEGTYQLGENNGVFTSIFPQTQISYVSPAGSGWALYRANPKSINVPIETGYTNASLKGIYVKPCNSNVWSNIQDTVYAIPAVYLTETVIPGVSFEVHNAYYSYATGVQPSATYACGGEYVIIQTYIGPQAVRTNAEVEFAYVVEFN